MRSRNAWGEQNNSVKPELASRQTGKLCVFTISKPLYSNSRKFLGIDQIITPRSSSHDKPKNWEESQDLRKGPSLLFLPGKIACLKPASFSARKTGNPQNGPRAGRAVEEPLFLLVKEVARRGHSRMILLLLLLRSESSCNTFLRNICKRM